MQTIITPHKYLKPIIATTVALICLVLGVVFLRPSQAHGVGANERIITVHDDGVDKGFVTNKKTVREALLDGGIRLDAHDRTEPNLDEKLVANSYQINIYRARPVLIRDGSKEMTFISAYRTGAQIAQDAHISLRKEDVVTLSASTDPIKDGAVEVMTITRATPFTFVFYGKTEQAYTQAKTVGAMLKEKGIKLGAADKLSVGQGSPITNGATVRLWREGTQTMTQDEGIAFTTKTIKDTNRDVGFKEIQTPGKDGKRTVTYEIVMRDGIEVSRVEINSTTIDAAVEQVEIIGTKAVLPAGSHEDWMAAAGISASDYGYVNYIVEHEDRSWEPCKVQGGAVDCMYDGDMGYGLVQATPGRKMASAGSDWRTNPITQLKWASGYAVGRYGSWRGAYEHWLISRNW